MSNRHHQSCPGPGWTIWSRGTSEKPYVFSGLQETDETARCPLWLELRKETRMLLRSVFRFQEPQGMKHHKAIKILLKINKTITVLPKQKHCNMVTMVPLTAKSAPCTSHHVLQTQDKDRKSDVMSLFDFSFLYRRRCSIFSGFKKKNSISCAWNMTIEGTVGKQDTKDWPRY